jgi:transposase
MEIAAGRLHRFYRRPIDAAEQLAIAKLWREGKNTCEIAATIGQHESVVEVHLWRFREGQRAAIEGVAP